MREPVGDPPAHGRAGAKRSAREEQQEARRSREHGGQGKRNARKQGVISLAPKVREFRDHVLVEMGRGRRMR